MSGCLKQFGRLGSLSLVACAFLLLSAPQSVSIADDDIKALERKLELLKKKASRKTEYKKMRGMLEVKLKEVQDQIQMLDEEYKDVAKSAPAPVAKKKVAKKKAAAGGFDEIIYSMKDADIALKFVRFGTPTERPFKIKKVRGTWVLVQQMTQDRSKLVYKGDNVLLMNEFPPRWPINGTWKFSKNGNKCRIDQIKSDVRPGKRDMTWKC